jgi:hypothetical protein
VREKNPSDLRKYQDKKACLKSIFNVVCGIVYSFAGVHLELSCCGLADRMGLPGHSYGIPTGQYISLARDRFFFEPEISKALACS